MAKLTLLEIVQNTMNDMDSDEVNSISDTEEALQIAQIAKTTYFEMIGRRDWSHLSKFTVLESVSDSTKPTHLGTPENMVRMDWFKYNKKKAGDVDNNYKDVDWLYPDEFITETNNRNLSESNVEEVTDFGGAKLQVFNDRAPTYFTSFDDEFIVMDSYDAAVESAVQGDKSQVKIYTIPTWSMLDDFIPDLPMEAFPAYIAEVSSVASFKLDDEVDTKAEQQSERQQKRLSVDGWAIKGGIRYPDYGRRGGRATSATLFNRDQRT